MFNKCFWLGHTHKPIAVYYCETVDTKLRCTSVTFKCSRCGKLDTDVLEGAMLTLEQVQKDYK